MYGAKYHWIIVGGYPPDWWMAEDAQFNLTCSAAQLNDSIQGYISTDVLPLSTSTKMTESGLVCTMQSCNTLLFADSLWTTHKGGNDT
ncbi:hypothetical protein DPMN_012258 [Dreissena polymorpha]|uniref:Uncharacterized protein n=1 Tax=Dreissena polymorpha TaxID=45954 RepID=A0A9D4S374_DREPO|nr:hypothetical protein DPMN_012258 [Dreissena polymorpha]